MARLDTGWHEHPRVIALGVAGMAVHAWSISYCDATRSDGFIPAKSWPNLRGFSSGIKALLAAGLWEIRDENPRGFWLHDYTDYNRTKAQIELDQARAAERQRRHRNGVTNGVTNGEETTHVTASRAIRAPAPGPGPGFNSLGNAGRHAGRIARADARGHAHEGDESDPPEVLERLSRPPIGDGQHASKPI